MVQEKELQILRDVANRLRIYSIQATQASKSGYINIFLLLLKNY